MCVCTWTFANVCVKIKQIWVIFSHLKLWIAVARHNFKSLKILINYFSRIRVDPPSLWTLPAAQPRLISSVSTRCAPGGRLSYSLICILIWNKTDHELCGTSTTGICWHNAGPKSADVGLTLCQCIGVVEAVFTFNRLSMLHCTTFGTILAKVPDPTAYLIPGDPTNGICR